MMSSSTTVLILISMLVLTALVATDLNAGKQIVASSLKGIRGSSAPQERQLGGIAEGTGNGGGGGVASSMVTSNPGGLGRSRGAGQGGGSGNGRGSTIDENGSALGLGNGAARSRGDATSSGAEGSYSLTYGTGASFAGGTGNARFFAAGPGGTGVLDDSYTGTAYGGGNSYSFTDVSGMAFFNNVKEDATVIVSGTGNSVSSSGGASGNATLTNGITGEETKPEIATARGDATSSGEAEASGTGEGQGTGGADADGGGDAAGGGGSAIGDGEDTPQPQTQLREGGAEEDTSEYVTP